MKHPNRGGPRPGFRKPTNAERGLPPPKVVTSIRLSHDAIKYLNQLEESRSVVIERLIQEKMRGTEPPKT